MVVDDPVGSFPIWAQLALCKVSGGHLHFPKNQVSNLKMTRLDFGVVVFHYQVLITSDLLFCSHSDFVKKVQLQAHPLFIPFFIMVGYSIAGQSNFCWYNSFTSKYKAKRCLPCRCASHCLICPQDTKQFIRPYTLCPIEPSLDHLEQGLVCNLNLSIGLRVGGRGVVVLDP